MVLRGLKSFNETIKTIPRKPVRAETHLRVTAHTHTHTQKEEVQTGSRKKEEVPSRLRLRLGGGGGVGGWREFPPLREISTSTRETVSPGHR